MCFNFSYRYVLSPLTFPRCLCRNKHYFWPGAVLSLPVLFPQMLSASALRHRSAVSCSLCTAVAAKCFPAAGNIFQGDNILGEKTPTCHRSCSGGSDADFPAWLRVLLRGGEPTPLTPPDAGAISASAR